MEEEYGNLASLIQRYLSLQGGGSNMGYGGRVGFQNIPITNNLTANLGASGFRLPQYNCGEMKNYDAALNAQFGKNKQHELGIGASGINTIDPRYFINYGYKF